MTKRPAYQWYPGDFKRDTALQACSFEARSLWREMLDLMHDGEPYGHLTAGGVAIQNAQLARMVGISVRRCTAWLLELQERGVFSRTEQGVIYSRRMTRDEHIRTVRAAAGRLGGNPNLLKQPDNLPTKQKPTPAVAVAVASAEKPKTTTSAGAKAPRVTNPWLLPAARVWESRFGEGTFPWGEAGRHLKPLHRAGHPPPDMADHLGRYLVRTESQFVSLARFAKTFAEYKPVDANALVDEFGCLTPYGERETRPHGLRVVA